MTQCNFYFTNTTLCGWAGNELFGQQMKSILDSNCKMQYTEYSGKNKVSHLGDIQHVCKNKRTF